MINVIFRILAKGYTIRVAPIADRITHPDQSAFIQGRSLHNNFMLVRQVARKLHLHKIDNVLFKIDIARAFGSAPWLFLFKVLLFTASMKILVSEGGRFFFRPWYQARWPHLPLLFVIAMELLSVLFVKASEASLLDVLHGFSMRQNISVYANDVVMFSSLICWTSWLYATHLLFLGKL